MQVFKAFMKVTKKRLHIFLIYMVAFISIGIGMTASVSKDNEFNSTKLRVSITDLDDTEASRALTEYISKHNKIVEVDNDKDAVLDALYYRRADIVLTINEAYSEKLINGETDGLFSDYRIPGTFTAEFFDSQLDQYIAMVTAYTAGGLNLNTAVEKTAELMDSELSVEMADFSGKSGEVLNMNVSYYYQYLAYILTVMLIGGLCPTLLIMMRKEIRSRTNCSCVTPANQTFQIVSGTIILVIGSYIILMAVACMIYGIDAMFSQRGIMALLNGFVFLIFAMMLTLLITALSPAQQTVNMIANVISLGMSFLCGVFVPQELLGDTVLNIGKFLPAYWYIKANNMLSGTNGEIFSTEKYMMCICIELAFSLAMFCVTILIAKIKQSSKSMA